MELRKRKVLFIPAWYPSRVDPLAGIFTQRHAQAVKELVAVSVLYICGDEKLSRNFEAEETVENEVPTLRIFFRKSPQRSILLKLLNGLHYSVAVLWGYYLAQKKFGVPDICHVHVLTRSAIVPFLAFLTKKTPYIITEHWSRYLPQDNSYKGWIRKRITELLVKHSTAITVVSHALKSSMQGHGLTHNKFIVVPNVVDTELFKPGAPKVVDRPVFLHISSFDLKAKNIKGIIDAAVLADQEDLEFDLFLIGEGDGWNEINKYLNAIEFKKVRVCLLGKVDQVELVSFYQNALALIVFSHYETQGCVILEAMSCGIPIIGSNVGGISELLNSNSGILVEPGNVAALKDAFRSFLKQDIEFDSNVLRELAIKTFSYAAVAEKFNSLYADIHFQAS